MDFNHIEELKDGDGFKGEDPKTGPVPERYTFIFNDKPVFGSSDKQKRKEAKNIFLLDDEKNFLREHKFEIILWTGGVLAVAIAVFTLIS